MAGSSDSSFTMLWLCTAWLSRSKVLSGLWSAEKEKLLHMAREGAPTFCMHVYSRPSRSRFYHALACSLSSVRRQTQLACQTVSADMLLC